MSITLKSSKQKQTSSGTSITLDSFTVNEGDFVILLAAARKTFTVPTGYTLLYSEMAPDSQFTQTIYYMYKKITANGTESITLRQSSSERLYGIAFVVEGVSRVTHESGFNQSFTCTTLSRQFSKTASNIACIWGITTARTGTGSSDGPYTITPNNDVTIVTSAATYSTGIRLIGIFDDGTGATTHSIVNNATYERGFVIDALVLHEAGTTLYLIEDGGQLYTVQNGTLVTVSGTLSAALFESDGFDDLTGVGALLQTLTSPTVYAWSSTAQPSLLAGVTALPYPQDIESSIALVDVTGVDTITAAYTGEPLVAVKVDSGNYLIYDDVNETWVTASAHDGMTIADLQDVPSAEWETLLTGANTFGVRVTLSSTVDALNELLFAFLTN